MVQKPEFPQRPRVDDVLLREANTDEKLKWENLRTQIEQTKKELTGLLTQDFHSVAYGAPAKFTTFCETLKIGHHFKYVVDDSPLKQGLFTPASGVEVRDALALRTDPPARIVITAWNFAESIAKKLRETGITCPLIVPFPEVKVLP